MKADLRAPFRETVFLPRLLTALVGIPLVLVAAWLGGLWWATLLAVIVIVGATEFVSLHPVLSSTARGAAVAGAVVLASGIVTGGDRAATAFIFAGAVALAIAVWVYLRAPVEAGTTVWGRWPTALLGVLYLGLAGGVLIRWGREASFAAIVWLFATLWVNDTTAYFVGLAAGQHKLAPKISPGKSWEGGLAGLLAATTTAAVGSVALGVPVWTGAVLGMAVSITAQAGDLFKSTMKRRVGVKDSGTLLPGHGGIIDRFDGLLVASPVAYLLIRLYGR